MVYSTGAPHAARESVCQSGAINSSIFYLCESVDCRAYVDGKRYGCSLDWTLVGPCACRVGHLLELVEKRKVAITRIDRLVAFQVLRLTLLVLAVVGVLSALFLFIDNQHDVGTGQYSLSDALWLALILLPTQLVQLMPIAALLGALLGFCLLYTSDAADE